MIKKFDEFIKESYDTQTNENRYVMGWSQAEGGWMIVYAETLEDADEKFENGEYTIEDEGDKNLILDIFDKKIEFLQINDVKLFTYIEADSMMKDGWEMLNGEEWDYIKQNYDCIWDKERKGLLIDDRIFLPSANGEFGEYWIPERIGPDDTYETLYFSNEGSVEQGYKEQSEKCQVCLVRYIK